MLHQLTRALDGRARPLRTGGSAARPPAQSRRSACHQAAAHPLAPGWTLNTTALPAEIMPMEFDVIVASGLVTGVMAPITP